MPKVDFYILSDTVCFPFACRLIEKIYKQNHRIYVHAENQSDAHTLDELLWTYRDDSFLPHNLYGEGPEPVPPIQIGFNVTPEKHRDVLINLSNAVPPFYTQFMRVLELVARNQTAEEKGRERYRFYRAEGFAITTHKLETIEN
ncbi:MAG: hypothetical protein ACD_60C00031G0002 [uncultured bacterium]|nr:MAG: hypothetical protein ACD_60C00031G0002 [uncultured bacterium]